MILKFEFLCKFILCISALFFMLRKCYRIKSSKKNIILVLFFGIIVAFASMHIDSILPDITETVKLTALGEKNTAAQSDEIVLYGIRVDNKETKIDSPREGKWFWGTNYMWRNEDDSRQPKGTTRSIVLDISVGWEREIVFLSNPWGGFVQIDCLGQTQVIDTYSDSYSYLNVLLAQSRDRKSVV